MVHRQRFDLAGEMRHCAERHLCAVDAGQVDFRQRGCVFLKAGLDLQNHFVLAGRGIDRSDLPLAEGVIERLVDQR